MCIIEGHHKGWKWYRYRYQTEAEDIKKRWQEYTELYKKGLHDPDNHNSDHSPRTRHPGM